MTIIKDTLILGLIPIHRQALSSGNTYFLKPINPRLALEDIPDGDLVLKRLDTKTSSQVGVSSLHKNTDIAHLSPEFGGEPYTQWEHSTHSGDEINQANLMFVQSWIARLVGYKEVIRYQNSN